MFLRVSNLFKILILCKNVTLKNIIGNICFLCSSVLIPLARIRESDALRVSGSDFFRISYWRNEVSVFDFKTSVIQSRICLSIPPARVPWIQSLIKNTLEKTN